MTSDAIVLHRGWVPEEGIRQQSHLDLDFLQLQETDAANLDRNIDISVAKQCIKALSLSSGH